MEIQEMLTIMEWGYRACEKGWNLQKAQQEFIKLGRKNESKNTNKEV